MSKRPRHQTWFQQFALFARGIALLITFTFLLPYLTWAFDNANYVLASSKALGLQYAGRALAIPEKFGTVQQSFQGSGPTVVCIQDLHCNYEAQNQIAGMIRYLAREHDLRLIGEEGAFGTVDVGVLRDFPLAPVREAIGDYFVRQGKLTGAEQVAATFSQPLRLEGIEAQDLYETSLATVRSFLTAESQGYVADLRDLLEGVKPKLYTPALAALDETCKAYREGRLDLLRYALALKTDAAKLQVETGALSAFNQYLRQGRIPGNQERFYQELDQLDLQLRERLYTSGNQRALDAWGRRLDLMEKLVNISATPEEVKRFNAHRAEYTVKALGGFLRQQDPQAGELWDDALLDLDGFVDRARSFYELADQRSFRFVDNLLQKMTRSQTQLAVMINGGFHTEGIAAELKHRNVSFIVIQPSLTRQDWVNPYYALLQGKKLPLEKLLEKKQSIFAVRTWTETPDFKRVLEALESALALAKMSALKPESRRALQAFLNARQAVRAEPLDAAALGVGLPAQSALARLKVADGNPDLYALAASQAHWPSGQVRTQNRVEIDSLEGMNVAFGAKADLLRLAASLKTGGSFWADMRLRIGRSLGLDRQTLVNLKNFFASPAMLGLTLGLLGVLGLRATGVGQGWDASFSGWWAANAAVHSNGFANLATWAVLGMVVSPQALMGLKKITALPRHTDRETPFSPLTLEEGIWRNLNQLDLQPGLQWKHAVQIPWDELVRSESAWQPDTSTPLNYWANNYDSRELFLAFFNRLLRGEAVSLEQFIGFMKAMNILQMAGKKGDSFYDPPTYLFPYAGRYAPGELLNEELAEPGLTVMFNKLQVVAERMRGKKAEPGDVLPLIADFYIAGIEVWSQNGYFFERGNHSMHMNMINALLRLEGLRGIPHGYMDKQYSNLRQDILHGDIAVDFFMRLQHRNMERWEGKVKPLFGALKFWEKIGVSAEEGGRIESLAGVMGYFLFLPLEWLFLHAPPMVFGWTLAAYMLAPAAAVYLVFWLAHAVFGVYGKTTPSTITARLKNAWMPSTVAAVTSLPIPVVMITLIITWQWLSPLVLVGFALTAMLVSAELHGWWNRRQLQRLEPATTALEPSGQRGGRFKDRIADWLKSLAPRLPAYVVQALVVALAGFLGMMGQHYDLRAIPWLAHAPGLRRLVEITVEYFGYNQFAWLQLVTSVPAGLVLIEFATGLKNPKGLGKVSEIWRAAAERGQRALAVLTGKTLAVAGAILLLFPLHYFLHNLANMLAAKWVTGLTLGQELYIKLIRSPLTDLFHGIWPTVFRVTDHVQEYGGKDWERLYTNLLQPVVAQMTPNVLAAAAGIALAWWGARKNSWVRIMAAVGLWTWPLVQAVNGDYVLKANVNFDYPWLAWLFNAQGVTSDLVNRGIGADLALLAKSLPLMAATWLMAAGLAWGLGKVLKPGQTEAENTTPVLETVDAGDSGSRFSGDYFEVPGIGHVAYEPLRVDPEVKAAADRLGIVLDWDDEGRICNLSPLDAKRLVQSLGWGMLTPAQYFEVLRTAAESGNTRMVQELMSRRYAEMWDVLSFEENGRHYMIENPTIREDGSWDRENDQARIKENNMPPGRHGWFTLENLEDVFKVIEKEHGFPYAGKVDAVRRQGAGYTYKYWDIYTELAKNRVAAIRSYVTSSGTPSSDWTIPPTTSDAKNLKLRVVRQSPPSPPLDEAVLSRLNQVMKKFDLAMSQKQYRDFYDDAVRNRVVDLLLDARLTDDILAKIRVSRDNRYIKLREKAADVLGFLRLYALAEQGARGPAFLQRVANWLRFGRWAENQDLLRQLEHASQRWFGVEPNAVSDEAFHRFVASSRSRLQTALDPKHPLPIVFVMGHKNPDTDTAISALLEAFRNQLINPQTVFIPVIQGNRIPDEIRRLLDENNPAPLADAIFLSEDPLYAQAKASGQASWILVDQNVSEVQKYTQSILDHHTPSEIALRQDVAKTIEIVGSTTGLVVQRFHGLGADLPGALAGLAYGATLMDTENRKEDKTTEKDRYLMDRLLRQAGLKDPVNAQGKSLKLYPRLMDALLSTQDAQLLFGQDYKEDWGFGFAVAKMKGVFDRQTGEPRKAEVLQRMVELAQANNERKNFPLTLIKAVDYEEDNETVFKERMYFVFGPDAGETFKTEVLHLFELVLGAEYPGEKLKTRQGRQGADYIEWWGVGAQLSRKKVAPVLEPVVRTFNRYFYSHDLKLFVSREFLKETPQVQSAAEKLGIRLSVNEHGYINYVSPFDFMRLMDELGGSILSLKDYAVLRKEAERRRDLQLSAGLQDEGFTEVLDTLITRYDEKNASGEVIDHPKIARDETGYRVLGTPEKVSVPRGTPGLFEWENTDSRGFPETMLYPMTDQAQIDRLRGKLSRYWAPVQENSVAVRSSIFLYGIPCMDLKIKAENEVHENLGVRPCRREVPEPLIRHTLTRGRIETVIVTEEGMRRYVQGVLKSESRLPYEDVSERVLENLAPADPARHTLDVAGYLQALYPDEIWRALQSGAVGEVALHYGPLTHVQKANPQLLEGYRDLSALDPDGAWIGWFVKNRPDGKLDIIITNIRGPSKLKHMLYALAFQGQTHPRVYDYHFNFETFALQTLRQLPGAGFSQIAIGKSVFGRKLLRKIKFGQIFGEIRRDLQREKLSRLEDLLRLQLHQALGRDVTPGEWRALTAIPYVRSSLDKMQAYLDSEVTPRALLIYWAYGDAVEDYVRVMTTLHEGIVEISKFAKMMEPLLNQVRISGRGEVIYQDGKDLRTVDLSAFIEIRDKKLVVFKPGVTAALLERALAGFPEVLDAVKPVWAFAHMFTGQWAHPLKDYTRLPRLNRLREKFDIDEDMDPDQVIDMHVLRRPADGDLADVVSLPVGHYPFGELAADFVSAGARLKADTYIHGGSAGYFFRDLDEIRQFQLRPGDLIIPEAVYNKQGARLQALDAQTTLAAAKNILETSGRPYRVLQRQSDGKLRVLEGASAADRRPELINLILTRHVSVDTPLEEDAACVDRLKNAGIDSVDCETGQVIQRMQARHVPMKYLLMFWVSDLPGQEGDTLASEKALHPIAYVTRLRKVQGLISDIYLYLQLNPGQREADTGSKTPSGSVSPRAWLNTAFTSWVAYLKTRWLDVYFNFPQALLSIAVSPLLPFALVLISSGAWQAGSAPLFAWIGSLDLTGGRHRAWVEKTLVNLLVNGEAAVLSPAMLEDLRKPAIQAILLEIKDDAKAQRQLAEMAANSLGIPKNAQKSLQNQFRRLLVRLITEETKAAGTLAPVLSTPQAVADALFSQPDQFLEAWKSADFKSPEGKKLANLFLDALTQIYRNNGPTVALGCAMPLTYEGSPINLPELLNTREALQELAGKVAQEISANAVRAREQAQALKEAQSKPKVQAAAPPAAAKPAKPVALAQVQPRAQDALAEALQRKKAEAGLQASLNALRAGDLDTTWNEVQAVLKGDPTNSEARQRAELVDALMLDLDHADALVAQAESAPAEESKKLLKQADGFYAGIYGKFQAALQGMPVWHLTGERMNIAYALLAKDSLSAAQDIAGEVMAVVSEADLPAARELMEAANRAVMQKRIYNLLDKAADALETQRNGELAKAMNWLDQAAQYSSDADGLLAEEISGLRQEVEQANQAQYLAALERKVEASLAQSQWLEAWTLVWENRGEAGVPALEAKVLQAVLGAAQTDLNFGKTRQAAGVLLGVAPAFAESADLRSAEAFQTWAKALAGLVRQGLEENQDTGLVAQWAEPLQALAPDQAGGVLKLLAARQDPVAHAAGLIAEFRTARETLRKAKGLDREAKTQLEDTVKRLRSEISAASPQAAIYIRALHRAQLESPKAWELFLQSALPEAIAKLYDAGPEETVAGLEALAETFPGALTGLWKDRKALEARPGFRAALRQFMLTRWPGALALLNVYLEKERKYLLDQELAGYQANRRTYRSPLLENLKSVYAQSTTGKPDVKDLKNYYSLSLGVLGDLLKSDFGFFMDHMLSLEPAGESLAQGDAGLPVEIIGYLFLKPGNRLTQRILEACPEPRVEAFALWLSRLHAYFLSRADTRDISPAMDADLHKMLEAATDVIYADRSFKNIDAKTARFFQAASDLSEVSLSPFMIRAELEPIMALDDVGELTRRLGDPELTFKGRLALIFQLAMLWNAALKQKTQAIQDLKKACDVPDPLVRANLYFALALVRGSQNAMEVQKQINNPEFIRLITQAVTADGRLDINHILTMLYMLWMGEDTEKIMMMYVVVVSLAVNGSVVITLGGKSQEYLLNDEARTHALADMVGVLRTALAHEWLQNEPHAYLIVQDTLHLLDGPMSDQEKRALLMRVIRLLSPGPKALEEIWNGYEKAIAPVRAAVAAKAEAAAAQAKPDQPAGGLWSWTRGPLIQWLTEKRGLSQAWAARLYDFGLALLVENKLSYAVAGATVGLAGLAAFALTGNFSLLLAHGFDFGWVLSWGAVFLPLHFVTAQGLRAPPARVWVPALLITLANLALAFTPLSWWGLMLAAMAVHGAVNALAAFAAASGIRAASVLQQIKTWAASPAVTRLGALVVAILGAGLLAGLAPKAAWVALALSSPLIWVAALLTMLLAAEGLRQMGWTWAELGALPARPLAAVSQMAGLGPKSSGPASGGSTQAWLKKSLAEQTALLQARFDALPYELQSQVWLDLVDWNQVFEALPKVLDEPTYRQIEQDLKLLEGDLFKAEMLERLRHTKRGMDLEALNIFAARMGQHDKTVTRQIMAWPWDQPGALDELAARLFDLLAEQDSVLAQVRALAETEGLQALDSPSARLAPADKNGPEARVAVLGLRLEAGRLKGNAPGYFALPTGRSASQFFDYLARRALKQSNLRPETPGDLRKPVRELPLATRYELILLNAATQGMVRNAGEVLSGKTGGAFKRLQEAAVRLQTLVAPVEIPKKAAQPARPQPIPAFSAESGARAKRAVAAMAENPVRAIASFDPELRLGLFARAAVLGHNLNNVFSNYFEAFKVENERLPDSQLKQEASDAMLALQNSVKRITSWRKIWGEYGPKIQEAKRAQDKAGAALLRHMLLDADPQLKAALAENKKLPLELAAEGVMFYYLQQLSQATAALWAAESGLADQNPEVSQRRGGVLLITFLLTRLLSYERFFDLAPENTDMKQFDLRDVYKLMQGVPEILKMFRESDTTGKVYKHPIIVDLEPGFLDQPHWVQGDLAGFLVDALMPVVDNAHLAVEESVQAALQTPGAEFAPDIRIRFGADRVTVTDNGPGLSPEIIKNFGQWGNTSRREQGGSGIGTHFAVQTMRRHAGDLKPLAGQTQGAGFVFEFKLSAAPASETQVSAVIRQVWDETQASGEVALPEAITQLLTSAKPSTGALRAVLEDLLHSLDSAYLKNPNLDEINHSLLSLLRQGAQDLDDSLDGRPAAETSREYFELVELLTQAFHSQAWLSPTNQASHIKERGLLQGETYAVGYERDELNPANLEWYLKGRIFDGADVLLYRNREALLQDLNQVLDMTFGAGSVFRADREAGQLDADRLVSAIAKQNAKAAVIDDSPAVNWMRLAERLPQAAAFEVLIVRSEHKIDPASAWVKALEEKKVSVLAVSDVQTVLDGLAGREVGLATRVAVLIAFQKQESLFTVLTKLRKKGGNLDGFSHWFLTLLSEHTLPEELDETQYPNFYESVDPADFLPEVPRLKEHYAGLLAHLQGVQSLAGVTAQFVRLAENRIKMHLRLLDALTMRGPPSPADLENFRTALREYRTLLKHVLYFQWRQARETASPGALETLTAALEAKFNTWFASSAKQPNPRGALLFNSGMSAAKTLLGWVLEQEKGRAQRRRILCGNNAYYEVENLLNSLQKFYAGVERIRERDFDDMVRRVDSGEYSALMIDPVSNAFPRPQMMQGMGQQPQRESLPVSDIRNLVRTLAARTYEKPFYLMVDVSLSSPDMRVEALLQGVQLPANFHVIFYSSLQKLYQNGLELTTGGALQVFAHNPAQLAKALAALKQVRTRTGYEPALYTDVALNLLWEQSGQISARTRTLMDNTEAMARYMREVMGQYELVGHVIHPSLPDHPDHATWLKNGGLGVPFVMIQFDRPYRALQKELIYYWSKRLNQLGLSGILGRDSFGFDRMAFTYYYGASKYEALRVSLAPFDAKQMDLVKEAFRLAYEDFNRLQKDRYFIPARGGEEAAGTAALGYWIARALQTQLGTQRGASWLKWPSLLWGAGEAVGFAVIFSMPLASISWVAMGIWLGLTLLHLPLMYLAGIRGGALWKAFFRQAALLLGYGVLAFLGLRAWVGFWAGAHVLNDFLSLFSTLGEASPETSTESSGISSAELFNRPVPTRNPGTPLAEVLGEGRNGTPLFKNHFLGDLLYGFRDRIFGGNLNYLLRNIYLRTGAWFGLDYEVNSDYAALRGKACDATQALEARDTVFVLTVPAIFQGVLQRAPETGVWAKLGYALAARLVGSIVYVQLNWFVFQTKLLQLRQDLQALSDSWAYAGARTATLLQRWFPGLGRVRPAEFYRNAHQTRNIGITRTEVMKLLDRYRQTLNPGARGLGQELQTRVQALLDTGQDPTTEALLETLRLVDTRELADPMMLRMVSQLQTTLREVQSAGDPRRLRLEINHIADLIIHSREAGRPLAASLQTRFPEGAQLSSDQAHWLFDSGEAAGAADMAAALLQAAAGTPFAADLEFLHKVLTQGALSLEDSHQLLSMLEATAAQQPETAAVPLGEDVTRFAGCLAWGGRVQRLAVGRQAMLVLEPAISTVLAPDASAIARLNAGEFSSQVLLVPFQGRLSKLLPETGDFQKDLGRFLKDAAVFQGRLAPTQALAQAYYRWHQTPTEKNLRLLSRVLLRILRNEARRSEGQPAAEAQYQAALEAADHWFGASGLFKSNRILGTHQTATIQLPACFRQGEKLRYLALWRKLPDFTAARDVEMEMQREQLINFRTSGAA